MSWISDDDRAIGPWSFYGEDTDEVRAFMERWSNRLFFVALAVSMVVAALR